MSSKLLQAILDISHISKEEEKLILNSFKESTFRKGDFLLKAGKIARYVAFLEEGLVRYFVYKNGEESTFEFTSSGEFISDYQSFRSKTPSNQNIQAIEDCKLYLIGYDALQKIFREVENGNLLGRIIVEHRFDVMVNQLLSVYMHSHEERYIQFVKHYSDLTQRIPQYMIASYVGVKPESLSRIRKRFTEGNS